MKIEWRGVTYGFDASEMTLTQAFVIKDFTKDVLYPAGRSLSAWQKGLNEADPACVTAAYWLMLQQAGRQVPIAEIGDEFPVLKFNNALVTATIAEAKAEAERKAAEDKAKAEAEAAAAVPTPAPSPAPGSPPGTTLPPLPGSGAAG